MTLDTENAKTNIVEKNAKQILLRFLGGAGAGLIAFSIFGGLWQVDHFFGVMIATSMGCGLIALLLGQDFKKMLNSLMENAPWV